jgi:hypothetical protein
MITINLKSGGQVDFAVNMNPMHGQFLYLHVDQSSNMNNGEGDAAVLLSVSECKEMIGNINEFIKSVENEHFVVTKQSVIDLVSKPEVQEALIQLGIEKEFNDL